MNDVWVFLIFYYKYGNIFDEGDDALIQNWTKKGKKKGGQQKLIHGV